MKTSSPIYTALAAVTTLILVGVGGVSATPITRGFVRETPREFEYNSGFLGSGDYLTQAFSVFGAYPGHFDLLNIDYSPEVPWENDSLVVVGTSNINSFYWSGDYIAGSGQFFDFGTHPLLMVTATFQDAILNSSIGNVNVRGYYRGRIENEHPPVAQVPDSGSTLGLLGGTFVVGLAAWRSKLRTAKRNGCGVVGMDRGDRHSPARSGWR